MAEEKNPSNEEFIDDAIPQANWMKFENVGDYIKGTFIRKSFQAGKDNLPDQMVYELIKVKINDEDMDPEVKYNVGIAKHKTFVNDRLEGIKPGQRMGIKFKEEIEAKKKGFNPAKSLVPYMWEMDPDFNAEESFDVNDVSFEE